MSGRTYPKRVIPSGGPQHRIPKLVHGRKTQRSSVTLHPTHDAVREGRTLFPSTVVNAEDSPRLLVDGYNQRKIGRRITKGDWAGMPIYTLTLEERATCPRSCKQWLACYGNNMHFSRRHRLDEDMIVHLYDEIEAKAAQHPHGFVVRAHILGDFGSPDNAELAMTYVRMWRLVLSEFPALHMWSYTAHHPDGEIGQLIRALNANFPDRCRVRFSGHDLGGEGAVVIDRPEDSQHVICPAQTDRTDCCATCALCWSMDRTVEFLKH